MGKLIKLTVSEILPALDKVENHGTHWKALCPAHDDQKCSLSIKEGNDGSAICNCFAGCTQSEIFKAINSRLGRNYTFEDEDKPKVIARYDYTDENGKIINTKVRRSDKSFYWTIKGSKTPLPLFNLNEVIAHDLIFLVEGEKDVLTLKKLNYAATNLKDGFTSENATRYLTGKDIIIIPDNDKAGYKYSTEAGDKLIGIANSIKIVELKRVWSEVPPKGDISDYVQSGLSIDKIIEMANSIGEYNKERIEDSPESDPLDVAVSNHPHYEIWKNIEGYKLNERNQIVFDSNNQPLLHGSIVITEVIYKNDGFDDDIEFKCEGVTEDGEVLPEVIIPVDEFDSLKWISKKWECKIITFGSQTTNQKLISGIKLTGQKAKRTYKHCHTGYVIDKTGKPIAYLHAGGSIGNQGIVCEMDEVLNQYKLSGCSSNDKEKREAFHSSLQLLKAHRESVTFPLLSFVYMPPISQIIKEVNGESGFCLYLRGKTQNGKSTLSALAMSHYGEFTSTTPPTSFESTARYNEYMSSLLKDSVLWIDDFHPKGTKAEKDKQNEQFNKIARASGDRAFRGRLNSNAESGKIYIPRCLYLVTGEDDPQLSQSGIARIFTIDVKTERRDLSSLFQASRNGLLSRAMSDYISYIIENYDEAKRWFIKRYNTHLQATRMDVGENRLSIQSALLMTSMDSFLAYACRSGLIDKAVANETAHKNDSIITAIAHKNDEEIRSSDPVVKFITTLSTMLSNREVEVRECRYPSDDNELFGENFIPRIGWFDEEFYYLDKERAYSVVKNKLESVEDNIGATIKGLYRDMLDRGLIIGDLKNNPTKLKSINGKPKRVIFIKKTILDIEENTSNK